MYLLLEFRVCNKLEKAEEMLKTSRDRLSALQLPGLVPGRVQKYVFISGIANVLYNVSRYSNNFICYEAFY